ncbi:MAG: electron transport complex subunit RsxE [Eubacterium sp.]|nr:electron transport complex subunit RsxE [Eubacterium sp.]
MNKCFERLYNGIIKENPTFVQMLGMCPTLAVTTTAINGLGMGLATTAVLTMSNLIISMFRNVIPDKVRIPAYITIIASFVTVVSFIMQAYTPELFESLGVFISLIVVNCIILGRAEAYASKNKVIPSVFDGIGMGLGFTLGLTVIGIIREFIGAGSFFGMEVTTDLWEPVRVFTMSPGAFFVLAFIVAIINGMAIRKAKKKGCKPELRKIDSCAGCMNLSCAGRNVSVAEAENIMQAAAEKRAAESVKTAETKTVKTAEAAENKKSGKTGALAENKKSGKTGELADNKKSGKTGELTENKKNGKTGELAGKKEEGQVNE